MKMKTTMKVMSFVLVVAMLFAMMAGCACRRNIYEIRVNGRKCRNS